MCPSDDDDKSFQIYSNLTSIIIYSYAVFYTFDRSINFCLAKVIVLGFMKQNRIQSNPIAKLQFIPNLHEIYKSIKIFQSDPSFLH